MKSTLSYFTLSLESYLRENFPEKLSDKQFIQTRVDMASNAYSEALLNGYSHAGAGDIASEVLFEGLHYSPYNAIVEIICNEFDDVIPEDLVTQYAQTLLPVCATVFEKYDLKDDFASSDKHEDLYTELTGIIQMIIERNGLQQEAAPK